MKKVTEAIAENVEIVRQTGNVFGQIGRKDADDLLRKARVLNVINEVIEERALDQSDAAQILGIDQADVSRLIHGKLSRFSLERLMGFVDKLGVSIDFKQSRDSNGHLIIKVEQFAHA